MKISSYLYSVESDIKVLIQKMYISENGHTSHRSMRDVYADYELANNVKFDYLKKEYVTK